MNMKKVLFFAALAAVASAFADASTTVDSGNVFGVLRVDSTAAQTIVSIPWKAAGGGVIKVKDAIKTANLTEGDQLYYYDTTATSPSYKLWVLGQDGWEGATTVANGITPIRGSSEDELARGGALILVRQYPTKEGGAANPFYLYGQYESVAGLETALPANAFSLIAPPTTTSAANGMIDLNSAAKWTGITNADHIILPSGKQLEWGRGSDEQNCSWGVRTYANKDDFSGSWSNDEAKIPMGQGVWFKAGAGDNKSVAWGAF